MPEVEITVLATDQASTTIEKINSSVSDLAIQISLTGSHATNAGHAVEGATATFGGFGSVVNQLKGGVVGLAGHEALGGLPEVFNLAKEGAMSFAEEGLLGIASAAAAVVAGIGILGHEGGSLVTEMMQLSAATGLTIEQADILSLTFRDAGSNASLMIRAGGLLANTMTEAADAITKGQEPTLKARILTDELGVSLFTTAQAATSNKSAIDNQVKAARDHSQGLHDSITALENQRRQLELNLQSYLLHTPAVAANKGAIDQHRRATQDQILGIDQHILSLKNQKEQFDQNTKGLKDLKETTTAGTAELRPMGEVLQDTLQHLGNMTDKSEAARLTIGLFGARIGGQLVPVIQHWNELSETARAQASKLAGGFEDAEKKAIAYHTATTNLSIISENLGLKVLPLLTSALVGINHGFEETSKWIGEKLRGAIDAVSPTITSFGHMLSLGFAGGAIGGEQSTMMKSLFEIGAFFRTTLVPAFHDAEQSLHLFFLALKGGDAGGDLSALQKKFLDFGHAVRLMWEENIRPALLAFGDIVKTVVGDVIQHWDLIGPVFAAVGKILAAGVEVLITSVGGIVRAITGIVVMIEDLIHGRWSKAWLDLTTVAIGIAKTFGTVLKTTFDAFPDFIVEGVKAVINAGIDMIDKFIESISGKKLIPSVDLGPLGSSPGVSVPTIPTIPRLLEGLSYVPYDNFPALLDKGEGVLTASQNEAFRRPMGGKSSWFPFYEDWIKSQGLSPSGQNNATLYRQAMEAYRKSYDSSKSGNTDNSKKITIYGNVHIHQEQPKGRGGFDWGVLGWTGS